MAHHTISCPSCNREHTFSSEHIGKTAKCHCGNRFTLVDNQTQKEDSPAQKTDSPETVSASVSPPQQNTVLQQTETPQEPERISDQPAASPEPSPPEIESSFEPPHIPEKPQEAPSNWEDIILKPHKVSYFFFSYWILVLFFSIAVISSHLAGQTIFSIVFILFFVVICYGIYVSYKKERYIIQENKIIREFGTIFSDNKVEVQMNRIVILSCKRPWIANMLFGTGHIILKSAGSSHSKLNLSYMKEPLAVYDEIQGLLRKNGFHLQKDRLVQSEQPHILGIFGEMGSKFFGSIFALYYAVLFISSYQAEMGSGASASSLVGPGIMALLFAGIYAFFIYMDLRRRQYDIYDDAVEYKEGFLTKYDSIIPMENVSDVENTQSFFSKILGLHDIKISCQGSGNDVLFKNMAHGEQMIENIKYLKDAIIPKEKPKIVSKKESVVGYTDKIDEPLKYDEAFTGEYKMHMLRTLLPFLVFLIPPMTAVGFFLIISQIPRVLFTTFSITQSSIDKRFQFLSNKYTSYSIEKITGVVIRESLIDKMFGTCTVSFLSIGSSGDMNYHNIKKTPELEKNILQKVGIYTDGDKTKIETHFSFMEYLKANIGYGVLAMVLLMIALVFQSISFAITDTELQEMILALSYLLFVLLGMWVVFFLPFFIYKKIFYGEKFYQNSTFSDGVMSKKGIIFQAKYYALYRNIKGITSVKFPLTETGKLLFNVSGEKFVQSKKQNKLSKKPAGVMVSNTIQIPYTLQVQQTHFDFDEVLEGQKIDTNKVLESSQDIGNSIVVPLMCIVLFVLVTFGASVPIGLVLSIVGASIIGLIIWSIKVKYYDLEKSRIVAGSGIIYKKRQSILYSKFNFIELGRGFFNKIFKNGNISIYTLGSGKKEMSIQDTEDYQEIYDMLQVH